MPELPEVQTIVSDLNKKVIGRRVSGVWFDTPKMIKKPIPKEFGKQIEGLKISRVERRGKNILIYLSNAPRMKILLIHQKMTGHLLYGKWSMRKRPHEYEIKSLIKGPLEEKVNGYIHLVFYLDNGWQLALSDLRKFAKVIFGPREEVHNLPELKKLGPDALAKSFSVSQFISLVSSQKRKVKQVLMDQNVIAGIGNIYADEILWLAKIHPLRKANQLKANELRSSYLSMRQILKKALKLRGTSISDFRDTAGEAGGYGNIRLAYGREGEACCRCKTAIKRIKIGGRSSSYCPKCQDL